MVDGVEVDQGLGQQLAEEYHQNQQFQQRNNGNKSTNHQTSRKHFLVTLNANAALSGAAGGNVEFGVLFNLNNFSNNLTFSFYYKLGYSIGYEAYATFGGTMYYSSMQDFLGSNTKSFANNQNGHNIQAGPFNFSADQKGFNGIGGSLGVGTGFGDNLTNRVEATTPFILNFLFDPIAHLPFLK